MSLIKCLQKSVIKQNCNDQKNVVYKKHMTAEAFFFLLLEKKMNIILKRSCPLGLAPLCYSPIKYEVSGADIKYATLHSGYANANTVFLMF